MPEIKMPNVRGDGMRGLAVFISDIRNCKSKEAELKRINKELANIRSKFKGDKALDGYQKKKYVCKLLFIFLLGNDIDFGHIEAVNLLNSNKYSEKQIGYLFISVLMDADNELMRLVINNIRTDLHSRNPVFVNLALQCIANLGTKEIAEALGNELPKMLVSAETLDVVKQSAALCLLKLFRSSPEVIPSGEWTSRVIHLLNDQHMGVVTAACSLIEALSRRSPNEFKACVNLAVSRLSRLVTSSYTDLQDYTYYFVPAPWLSVKLLRLLQNFEAPSDPGIISRLNECLDIILNKAGEPPKSKKVQHSNAKNAVLFEAINLIIHLDCDPGLLVRACNQLGGFLQHRETNMRYLALEGMCLLATSEFSHEAVKKHQETVMNALKTERDISVRQRAIDLLYAMCDRTNAEEIVGEMLVYLEVTDYSMREEMVLKIAILAEKYASDYSWYVDVVLNLIRVAGDHVSEEVWFRVIQIVTNREDVQGYAAKTVFEALQAPACHENMVKVGGYILGEFGNLIAGDPRSSPTVQFELLHSKYHLCSIATRCLLLSTYLKFANLFAELKGMIVEVLRHDTNIRNSDAELQQRAVEYAALIDIADSDMMAAVCEEMPPFPERESSILAKLKKKKQVDDGEPPTPTREKMPQAQVKAADTIPAKKSEKASDDLLGLNSPSTSNAPPIAAPGAAAPGTEASILDLFDTVGTSAPVATAQGASGVLNATEVKKLLFRNSGVVFEDHRLQIGVKSEFQNSNNVGKVDLYYGNKASNPFTNFSATPVNPMPQALMIQVRATPEVTEIHPKAQIMQTVDVKCVAEFSDPPVLRLKWLNNGVPESVDIQIPVWINKWLESTAMTSDVFFQRWKSLAQKDLEAQEAFNAHFSMDPESTKVKLTGYGFGYLDGIDSNPDNFVCAGIVHTATNKVGVMLRLEPNKKARMYRLTVRSSHPNYARFICDALKEHF